MKNNKINYQEALCFMAEGMPTLEIADFYGVTENAVRNIIYKIKVSARERNLSKDAVMKAYGLNETTFTFLLNNGLMVAPEKAKDYEPCHNHSISSYSKPSAASDFAPAPNEEKVKVTVVNKPKAGIASLMFDTDNLLEFVGKPNYYILDCSNPNSPDLYKLEDLSIAQYKELSQKEMCVFFNVYKK